MTRSPWMPVAQAVIMIAMISLHLAFEFPTWSRFVWVGLGSLYVGMKVEQAIGRMESRRR